MHQQPPILELVKHANTDDWFNLGIHLQLNQVKLNKCMGDLSRVYSFWIQQEGEKATRRKLLDTLKAMEKTNTAEIYERYLKTLVS